MIEILLTKLGDNSSLYIHDNYSCKLLHNRKESNTNIEHIPTAIQADIMLTEKEGSM